MTALHQFDSLRSNQYLPCRNDPPLSSKSAARTMCCPGATVELQHGSSLESLSGFMVEIFTWLSLNAVPVAYNSVRQSVINSISQSSLVAPVLKRQRALNGPNLGGRWTGRPQSMDLPVPAQLASCRKSGLSHTGFSVRGVPNYGQTCFLNSVLQALASLPSFTAYLERIVDRSFEFQSFDDYADTEAMTESTDGTLRKGSAICESLLQLLSSINGQELNCKIDPRPVLQAVGREHKQFQAKYGAVTNADQQDAQELLQAVIGMVIDEGQFEVTLSVLPLSPDGTVDDEDDDNTISLANELAGIRKKRAHALIHSLQAHSIDTGEDSISANEEYSENPAARSSMSPLMTVGEEKKQEEFEIHIPRESSEDNLDCLKDETDNFRHARESFLGTQQIVPEKSETKCDLQTRSKTAPPKYATKAMEIMMTTTSSISPCPLSGWCGSALYCASCGRVRPMQNEHFLDIPIVPTAVSHGKAYASKFTGTHDPPCSLEECLKEYTRNELVRDVECKNCTLQSEISEQEFEKKLKEQLIGRLLLRRANRTDGGEADSREKDTLEHLQEELLLVNSRLSLLRRNSPDDDDPVPADSSNESDGEDRQFVSLKRSDAIKCLLLTRLPAVLSIHVQRRYYDQLSGRTSKTMQHVVFPEILDLAPFCAYGGEVRSDAPFAGSISKGKLSVKCERVPINYRLMSIIEHLGGPHSGHYVSYRRNPASDSQWLWISDDKVKHCDWSTVRKCQAYMLFYEAM
jgi:ubiquitin C-terminal hydrolase